MLYCVSKKKTTSLGQSIGRRRELQDPSGERGDERRFEPGVPRQRRRHLLRQVIPVRFRRSFLVPLLLLLLYDRCRWRCPGGGGGVALLAALVLGGGLAVVVVTLVRGDQHGVVLGAALHLLLDRARRREGAPVVGPRARVCPWSPSGRTFAIGTRL